jgi:HAD superfamily hydrolase (TIGR01509 family)
MAEQVGGATFDWDGTLLDSYAADARAYLEMFGALRIPWSSKILQRHNSPNWYHVYQAVSLPREKWDEADRLWMEAYAWESPRLVPGARRALRTAARRHVPATVTSGTGSRVRRRMKAHDVASHFKVCVCGEDAARRKPNPAPLLLALRRLGLRSGECVHIGDAPEDVEMARRAGVFNVAVQGPSPTRQTVAAARPDVLLASIEDLGPWLKEAGAGRR